MITNYLSPVGFSVNVKRLPNVEFFTQRVSIPGVSAGQVETQNPLGTLYNTGDKLVYTELDLNFIVDEDMKNYEEVLKWMESTTSNYELAQFAKLQKSDEGIVSDVSIEINNSSKQPNCRFQFHNCFPTSLSAITLDVTQSDVVYPEASITLRYDRFDFQRLS